MKLTKRSLRAIVGITIGHCRLKYHLRKLWRTVGAHLKVEGMWEYGLMKLEEVLGCSSFYEDELLFHDVKVSFSATWFKAYYKRFCPGSRLLVFR